jgi:uncharacterized damage-inducible protein DinB
MALKDSLLPEFDHEMGLTRRVLERVPFQDVAWAPHGKSMTLGALASHLADLPQWTSALLRESGFDIGESDNESGPRLKYGTLEELLAGFDNNVKGARDQIANTSDAQFMEPWTLRERGHEVFTQPRIATLRSFVLSHTIHHRGQMTVYLRLRDVPVPSIYGPSADER